MRLSPLPYREETVSPYERASCCVTSGSYAKTFDYRVGWVRYNEHNGQEEELHELPGSEVLGCGAESPVETRGAGRAGDLSTATTALTPDTAVDPNLYTQGHPERSAVGLTGISNESETRGTGGGRAAPVIPYGPEDYSDFNPSVPASMGLATGQLMSPVPVRRERSILRVFSVGSRHPRRTG